MSETFAETSPFLRERLAALQKDRDNKVAQLAARQTAQTMRELLVDPRWERFTRGVEAMKAAAEGIRKRGESDLLGKLLSPDQYLGAKVLQARGGGAEDALKDVLELIDKLIARGEQAEKELAKSND